MVCATALRNMGHLAYLQLVVLRPVALAAREALLVVGQSLLHDLLGLEDSPSASGTPFPYASRLRLLIHLAIHIIQDWGNEQALGCVE